jgi:hypothetical protein
LVFSREYDEAWRDRFGLLAARKPK